nr:pentatricopeptide repeat-containing protein [Quercus suber]
MVYVSSPLLHLLQGCNPLKPPIIYRSFQTSPDAYTKHIEMYAQDRALHSGKKLHAHLITTGFARLTHFAAKLIALYTVCGELSHARKLFDKIPTTNIHRWIALIGAYARCGFYQEALGVFREMQGQGLRPNNALIDMYSKCGQVEKAWRVYDGMVEKDLVALNAMVSGYAQHGFAKEALDLVKKMQALGVKPNVVTWNSLIAGFSQKGDQVMVSELFSLMYSNGVEPDVVSWTSVISGFVQNFRNDEAFAMFRKLLDHGFYPTSATVSSLLPACATAANVKCGKEIHGYALVIGVENDIFLPFGSCYTSAFGSSMVRLLITR